MFTHFHQLTQQSGLSGTNIRKILADPYGFIWIATQDGLNRFDGRRFLVFNAGVQDSTRATYGSDFHDMVTDTAAGALWASCSNGAIHRIDLARGVVTGRLPLYGHPQDSTPLPVYQLLLRKDQLYACSGKGFLFRIDTRRQTVTRKVNLAALLPGYAVNLAKIFEDDEGFLWTFINNVGIAILDPQWNKVAAFIPEASLTPFVRAPRIAFGSLCRVDDTRLLAATNGGPLLVDISKRRPLPLPELAGAAPAAMLSQATTCIAAFGDYIYFSGSNGLFRLSKTGNAVTSIRHAASYAENRLLTNAYALYADAGSLWSGNQEAVLVAPVDEPAYTSYQQSFSGNNVAIRHSYHLLAVNDSTVYSCAPDGIYKVNTRRSDIEKIAGGQPFYQLVKCPDGNILASGETDLLVVAPGGTRKAVLRYPELAALNNDFIIASANQGDSLLFLASQLYKGMYVWRPGRRAIDTLTLTSTGARLKDAEINNLLITGPNTLGIVCKSMYSVYNFHNNTITHHPIYDPATKAPAALLMDACRIGNRYYFAAYGRGVIVTDSLFNTVALLSGREGITSTGLYRIYALGDSAFLVSSNNGLFHYHLRHKTAHKISVEDGLHSGEFDETSGSRLGHYLYFGGPNGFTRIDVRKLRSSEAPPRLWLSAVNIKSADRAEVQTTGLSDTTLVVPNDYTQVSFHFSGLSFPHFSKVTYAYRIRNLQEEWISNGTQPFIDLIGVKHGHYKLEVRAFNEDGAGSATREMDLVILPRWYETWWFKILVAVAVAGGIYWLYLLRVRRFKREQQIRVKLANDLHDDLGSTMNSVKMYTNLAIMDEEPRKYLPLIKTNTQEAITGIKDIIWVLDDQRDGLEHLLLRIQHFAQPLCDAQSVQYRQEVADQLRDHQLGREEKRNLYMMLKEAVNNILKYAGAQTILITAAVHRGKLRISVADDGSGFDPDTAGEGNGLKNMRSRSRAIRYTCTIRSRRGEGTVISFRQD